MHLKTYLNSGSFLTVFNGFLTFNRILQLTLKMRIFAFYPLRISFHDGIQPYQQILLLDASGHDGSLFRGDALLCPVRV